MKAIEDVFKKLGSGLFWRVNCSAGMRCGEFFSQNYYEHPIWIKCRAISGGITSIDSIEVILGNHSGAVFSTDATKLWANQIVLPEKLRLIELDPIKTILRSVPKCGYFFDLEVGPLSFILRKRIVDDGYAPFRLTENMFESLFEITLSSSGLDSEFFRD